MGFAKRKKLSEILGKSLVPNLKSMAGIRSLFQKLSKSNCSDEKSDGQSCLRKEDLIRKGWELKGAK